MYDIKQLTKNSPHNQETISGITYHTFNLENGVYKFGFIGNETVIGYSLILTVNQRTFTVKIGKTGMYEFSPEIFRDLNDEESEEQDVFLELTQVKVPIPKNQYGQDISNFEYIIDYAIKKLD